MRRSFGDVKVLDGLDLTAPYGKVTGLVGANGAGKTTLLLILATLLAPDDGEITVAGLDARARPREARELLGWMPDTFGVYDRLTVAEYLDFFADAHGLRPRAGAARTAELLTLMGLEPWARQPVHLLSRGQKQRLGLARALVHRPKVLLLDEPASGLDPRARIGLRDVLRGQAAEGVAVLVSSHILAELEEIADRVALVAGGRSEGEWEIGDLLTARRGMWRLRALDGPAAAAALDRADVPHQPAPGGRGLDLGPLDEPEAADVLAGLVTAGVQVVAFGPVGGALESAFLSLAETTAQPDDGGPPSRQPPALPDGFGPREVI
ncbi:ABC transporter ATP-binding protein [Actinocorallia sp. A-T 12471]|uniref:ABC transporter ATP-binding protein n=1 Tax=Actinocorallia sp. A-T 12471 TaxID=3089813 RepID=UPI0029CDA260|nr:ABC transporter ATP-binding protein [Actinocorallia sp. A-T 12471]MDX6738350.1 ABC transporter ATP-binding protein [Actinocorallia sp. A-T 12471]